jgi:DNA helicase-2/ATP-dependent DNA helicase PcrA
MNFSPQQNDFFEWIKTGQGSCVLEAVAGSGKTTTLIEALKIMEGRIFFGAFNKKIAEEIQSRAPQRQGLFISTMHAAGFGAWRRAAPDVKVESNKCLNIFRDACERNPDRADEYRPLEGMVLKLVSYAKQAGVGILLNAADRKVWTDIIEHYDMEVLDNEDLIISLAKKTMMKSVELDAKEIDFDDMIYAPLFHGANFYKHDWVLIDEAQDTNAIRRAMALKLLKYNGRLVAVGDRHQAIYGFTGANADALDLIAKETNAVRMPLTVTYRCPKSVVAHAQQYVSHITAHESAPDGVVSCIEEGQTMFNVAKPGDAILCRFNAPIIEAVYSFIAAGVPAKVEGREIGQGLKTLARRWKSKSFSQMIDNLDKYFDREKEKFMAKEQEGKVAALEDKIKCLKVIISRTQEKNQAGSVVELVCEEIDKIFGDNVGKECVLLSTIHKSKGREWDKVLWLQTGPSPWAKQDWEIEQEVNLCYVATTRAKKELVLA